MKRIILAVFAMLLNTILLSQNIDTTIVWNINIVLERDIYGKITDSTRFVIQSDFSSDDIELIIFDYFDIEMSSYGAYEDCSKKFFFPQGDGMLSRLCVENEFGEVGNFSEFSPTNFAIYYFRETYDLVVINNYRYGKHTTRYSYPLACLTACNKNAKKIRLHYIYNKPERHSHYPVKSFHIVSNWFDLDAIR